MKPFRFALFFLLFCFLQEFVHSDFRIWTEINLSKDIDSHWNFETRYAARFDREAMRAYHYFVEVNLNRELARGWHVSPGYRQSLFRERRENQWIKREIPHLAVTKWMEYRGYEFSTRGRIEYRINEEVWRYRQRFSCQFPQKLTPLKFHPDSYCELFFRNKRGFSQYRLFFGFINDYLQLGYLFRQRRSERQWSSENILLLRGHYGF